MYEEQVQEGSKVLERDSPVVDDPFALYTYSLHQ